jgi:hypothetical protein
MVEATPIIAPTALSRLILIRARQLAEAAVRHRLKAQGRKLRDFSPVVLRALAQAYVAEHPELISEAELEQNSEHSFNAKGPATQALSLNGCHEQNGAPK